MERRAYEMELGGETYRLRLTAGAQMRLTKRYDRQAMQVCMDGIEDIDKMISVLNELLNWSGSGNPKITGEDFYDLMVDEGYSATLEIPETVIQAMTESGLLSETQRDVILKQLRGAVDAALEEAFPENPTEAGTD